MNAEKKQKIIKILNNEIGKSIKDLNKCYGLRKKYEEHVKYLKSSLSLDTPSSKISIMVQDSLTQIEKIDKIVIQYDDLSKEICAYLEQTDDIKKTVETYLSKIDVLEQTIHYLKTVESIDDLNERLKQAFASKNDELMVTLYANLCDISRSFIEVPANNIKRYLNHIIHHWHNILKDKYGTEFNQLLIMIKWPFISTNYNLMNISNQTITKLQLCCEYLFQIQLPEESESSSVSSVFLSDFPSLTLPISFFIRPLRKRFIYHFYGARKTNRLDRPEWYFTQILTWIRDHEEFLTLYVQPITDRLGLLHIDIKIDFMRGLVQLAAEKLCSDLPTIQFDDFSFSHCIDEALGFDRELRESYGYPSSQPSVLSILTQAQVFIKWLAMEKKYATEKLDVVFSSSDAFAPSSVTIDDLIATNCADMFITLLQTIKERYESLPQPGHRLQFLDLQLELLDDFRVRLLQLMHEAEDPIESRIPQIANTVNYVQNILMDWGTTVHYLHLYHYKTQFEKFPYSTNTNVELYSGTVFDETLSLYNHLKNDLINLMCDSVIHDIAARSRPYRKDRWANMIVLKNFISMSLTPTACPMFEKLATKLYQLQKFLAEQLFHDAWRLLASRIDTFLYEELILQNRFNEGGAAQLQFDMQRNLFPLFAQYTEKPHSYFNRINESCILLNLSKGSALLLKETILSLEVTNELNNLIIAPLEEIKVSTLTPKEAIEIINLRNDILSGKDLINYL